MKTNAIEIITFIGTEEPNHDNIYDICLPMIVKSIFTHALFLHIYMPLSIFTSCEVPVSTVPS